MIFDTSTKHTTTSMTDKKLGSLVAEIVVEGGYRPHYGARDAIDGKVILE